MKNLYIFSGPTLSLSDIPAQLHSTTRPSARRGDLLRLLSLKPDAILLVDTIFHKGPQPPLEEIITVMEHGVRVIGAGRQGAIRAADLEALGMEGRGRVFEMYKTGRLSREDEVAVHYEKKGTVLHLLSESLVNIRINLERAAEARIISVETKVALLELAGNTYYQKRIYTDLFTRLISDGDFAYDLEAYQSYLNTDAVDICREDALAALHDLIQAPEPKSKPELKTQAGTLYQYRLELEYMGRWLGSIFVPDTDVLRTTMLLDNDAQKIHRQSLITCLMTERARIENLTISSTEALVMQFQAEQNLPTSEALEEWLSERNMDIRELNAYLEDQAYCNALHAYLKDDQLEQVVLRGFASSLGVTVKNASAGIAVNSRTQHGQSLEEILMAWARFRPRRGLDLLTIRHLKYTKRFNTALSRLMAVNEFNTELLAANPDLQIEHLEKDQVRRFFSQYWQVPEGQFDSAMRLRGFTHVRYFDPIAKRHYLFERFRQDAIKGGANVSTELCKT